MEWSVGPEETFPVSSRRLQRSAAQSAPTTATNVANAQKNGAAIIMAHSSQDRTRLRHWYRWHNPFVGTRVRERLLPASRLAS